MGGPTTSRGRNVVVYACCCGVSVLPIARLSASVHSFERPVGCRSPLFFACISSFQIPFFSLDNPSKIHPKTNSFRFTIYDFDSVWTCPHKSVRAVSHGGEKEGNDRREVYPLLFWSNGGIGKTRTLEAPPRAPNCPKFSSDALARCPQTLPSTHTFFFSFSEPVVEAHGTAAHEGY